LKGKENAGRGLARRKKRSLANTRRKSIWTGTMRTKQTPCIRLEKNGKGGNASGAKCRRNTPITTNGLLGGKSVREERKGGICKHRASTVRIKCAKKRGTVHLFLSCRKKPKVYREAETYF